MRIINVKDMGLEAVEKLLKKPAFDQVELNPRIREANKKLFGAVLLPQTGPQQPWHIYDT